MVFSFSIAATLSTPHTNYACIFFVYLVKTLNLSRDPGTLRVPLPGRIRDCAPCRRKGFTCTTDQLQQSGAEGRSLHCLGVSHQHFHDPAVLLIMSTQHVLAKDFRFWHGLNELQSIKQGKSLLKQFRAIATMLQAGAFDSWKLWVNQTWEFQQWMSGFLTSESPLGNIRKHPTEGSNRAPWQCLQKFVTHHAIMHSPLVLLGLEAHAIDAAPHGAASYILEWQMMLYSSRSYKLARSYHGYCWEMSTPSWSNPLTIRV